MPRVAFVDSIRIEFYPNEHPPPHFHAVYAEHRAAFYISSLEIRDGFLPKPQERAVREWAAPRRIPLLRAWAQLRKGRKLGRVE
ncbi:MAG: DUF4160 domain-containing protein [Microvirga sp.]